MSPHPRIRKAIKWGGSAVTVLLLVVWIGSGWWYLLFTCPRGAAWFDFGHLTIHPARRGTYGWSLEFGRAHFPAAWSRTFVVWADNTGPMYEIPLWFPPALTGAVAALAYGLQARAARRARLNLCSKCTYDRAGLPVGEVCPECGASPAREFEDVGTPTPPEA